MVINPIIGIYVPLVGWPSPTKGSVSPQTYSFEAIGRRGVGTGALQRPGRGRVVRGISGGRDVFCGTPSKFNLTARPWKMMVRRLLALTEGLFLGAILLNFRGVVEVVLSVNFLIRIQKTGCFTKIWRGEQTIVRWKIKTYQLINLF